MNRAQRRSKMKIVHQPVVRSMTLAERDRIAEETFIKMLAVPVMVLRDRFDFEKPELERLADEILRLWDSVDHGHVTLQELEDCVFEETGMRIVKE